MRIDRRTFLRGVGAAGAYTLLPSPGLEAAIRPDSYATLIDLEKCDGCAGRAQPLCVTSCRENRQNAFPRPDKEQLLDYWPQKKHEDWSEKDHLVDRFTPYNWIFVQSVDVRGREIHIPRRCMHCDSPACAKLCPFGVNHKTPEGPVYIDENLCFGGAKCRDVCPWHVPQRQAGVGIYTLWQKYLPVGGGVLYKCDLCRTRLQEKKNPYCIEVCPRKAMQIGTRKEIFAKAEELKSKYNGDIYGLNENGGTSTLYVSSVPFKEIDNALAGQTAAGDARVTRMHNPDNILDKQKGWALLSVFAPIGGVIGAIVASLGFSSESGRGEDNE